MTDVKKVQITSVSSHNVEKKEVKRKRTVRLILTLPESNEKFCPEFNYGDLLSQHLSRRLGNKNAGEILNGPQREPGDPYASDEDEALKALARQFEQKYGTGGARTQKRRKRKKENDFKQLGEGYDETDPFIDNSDAVDDVLPTNVETKLGGFYINSGELNFEEVQVSEDEKTNDSDVQTLKRKRKNDILSSSEEEEAASGSDQEKDENKVRENGILKLKKRKLDEGEMLRRRKKMIDKLNAKKRKQVEKDEGTQESETETPKVNEIQAEEPKTANETSIAASIEAVVNAARESAATSAHKEDAQEEKEEDKEAEKIVEEEEEEKEEEEEEESSSDSSSSPSSSPETSSSESDSDDEKEDEKEEPERAEEGSEGAVTPIDSENDRLDASGPEKESSLPPNLPADVIAALDRIKEVGKKSKASSQKFFTEPVNKMLLSIELKLCKYRTKAKNQIYNHLSLHLPCGTQTLIKRGKNLLAEKLDERLKAPIKKLKEALDVVMPPLVEAHALECQKIVEQKGESNQKPEEGNASAEANKKPKLPKKKFEFTPELRDLLCAVVKIRCQAWHLIKKRSETPEEHVKSFLDSHLKGFWPKGWVTTKVLYKESQDAHKLITAKNSSKVVAGKKVTVLGGGSVSNPSSVDAFAKDVPPSVPSIPLDDSKKEKPPVEDKQPPASENAAQNMIQKERETLEEHPPICIEKSSAEKNESAPAIKITSPKGVVTPQKVLSDIQALSSVSPGSESSPKSFHGFESPSKPAEVAKCVDGSSAKQALFFDSVRKPLKGSSTENIDSLPLMREGKPPKPSLTATALPKISVSNSNSVSVPKADQIKKNHNATLEAQKAQKDDKKAITCITIKSVEKINEDVHPSPPKAEKEKEKIVHIESTKERRPPPKDPSILEDNVRVIDLSSDDEVVRMSTPQKRDTAVSPNTSIVSIRSSTPESVKSCASSVTTPEKDSFSKHNKLEQEMDFVMNELIQISKKNLMSSKEDSGNKSTINSGAVGDRNSSRNIRSSDKDPLIQSVASQQPLKRQNIQHFPQSNIKIPQANVNPYDLSMKSSSQSVPAPKLSPYSVDSNDQKSRNIHSSLQKQGSSERSFSNKSQAAPTQISSTAVHSQSHYTGAQDSNQSRSGTARVSQSHGHNTGTYQSSQNSSRGISANESYSKTQARPLFTSSTSQLLQKGLQRSNSGHASSQSMVSSNQPQRMNHNSGQMLATHTASSRLPSSNSVGSNSSLPSSLRTSPNQTGNQRTSPSSHAGIQGLSATSQNSNHRLASSEYNVSQRASPSTHSVSQISSGHGGNPRTSPAVPSGIQRAPPSAHSGGRSSSSTHALPSSNQRFSSERDGVDRISSSPKPAHLPTSSSHGRSPDSGMSHMRGYSSPQNPGVQSNPVGLSLITSKSSLHGSSGSKSGNFSQNSSSGASNNSSRSSKPSHNIEGLLYSSSSKGPEISSLDLRHSKYSHGHHSSQHREQKAQPKFSSNSRSWAEQDALSVRTSSGVKTHSGSSKSSNSSKHKSSNSSYPISGNGSDPLANLRQMEGLSIRNVQTKPSQSAYSNSSSSSRALVSPSSSQKNSSSAQPKVKQRSDSFSAPSSSPNFGNLSSEQQHELWQQINSGGYLPGISHGDVYKYLSQQGNNQSSNSTGNSSKKSSQY